MSEHELSMYRELRALKAQQSDMVEIWMREEKIIKNADNGEYDDKEIVRACKSFAEAHHVWSKCYEKSVEIERILEKNL